MITWVKWNQILWTAPAMDTIFSLSKNKDRYLQVRNDRLDLVNEQKTFPYAIYLVYP